MSTPQRPYRVSGHVLFPMLFLGAVLGLMACENSIDPLTDEGQDMFAVHGYLDASADTQYVRVEALRANVLEPPATLDEITVESVDETTGIMTAWQDSSITLINGDPGVIFFGVFRPEAGHAYRLHMYRPGREGASATTTIPEAANLRVGPPTGPDLVLRQRVSLENVGKPERIRMHYSVRDPGSSAEQEISVAYGDPTAVSSDDWTIQVQLKADQLIVLRELDREMDDQTVALRNLAISYYVEGPRWANPSDASNLTNTTGFFGAIGYHEQEWILDSDTVQRIGYVNEQDR